MDSIEKLNKVSLKTARILRGLTTSEAAERLGVTRQTLTSWEKGQTLPNVFHINRVEKVYGLKFDEIDFNIKGGKRNDC